MDKVRQLPQWLHQLILRNDTSKYYIQYKSFYANHLSHMLIALGFLGADEENCKMYIDPYVSKLESPEDYSHENQPDATIHMANILGKRKSYYLILQHYKSILVQEYSGNLHAFIQGEFPKLYLGMAGSALHGLIHSGYGYAARKESVVLEGFAYLHHSYAPLELNKNKHNVLQKFGTGKEDVIQVLGAIRQDKLFDETVKKHFNDPEFQDQDDLIFERILVILVRLCADQLMDYVYRIKINHEAFNPKEHSMGQIDNLLQWLFDIAVTVYVKSARRNDFFLVHGITSTWALRELIKRMQDYKTSLECVVSQLCIIIAVYLVEGKAELSEDVNMSLVVDEEFWENSKSKVLNAVHDEHQVKLIQVLYERWQENPDNAQMYGTAVRLILEKPFLP